MVKKVNKVQNNAQNNVQNQQVNNNGCQHVQLGGMAYYDAKQYFLFSPLVMVIGVPSKMVYFPLSKV